MLSTTMATTPRPRLRLFLALVTERMALDEGKTETKLQQKDFHFIPHPSQYRYLYCLQFCCNDF